MGKKFKRKKPGKMTKEQAIELGKRQYHKSKMEMIELLREEYPDKSDEELEELRREGEDWVKSVSGEDD